MQIIELSVVWTIVINIIAWAFFHMSLSFLTLFMPDHTFQNDHFLYKIKKWEKSGTIWKKYFRVKNWKTYIPDGAKLFKAGFEKKQLRGTEMSYLEKFILESRRAELTHWLQILPAGFFFFWNPLWAGWVMVAYALMFNVPIIIAQRYNRARFEQLVERKKKIRLSE